MGRWSGSAREHDRRLSLPRRWPAGAALTAVAAGAALGLGGCSSSPSATAGESATTQLQQAAGSLDSAKTFKLTMDTRVPKTAGAATGASASAAPGRSPAPDTEAIKMSGTWDVGSGLARMDGTLNSVKTTILSASGVEYVSLVPGAAQRAGKKWLKVDDSNATFGDFCNPQLVAQLLRAYHQVRLVSSGHLAGTIETSEADQHIADPNLVASLSGLPGTLKFDVWTDGDGAATKVEFHLSGSGAVTTGDVRLDSFGTAPAQVSVPTIYEVEQAPVG